MAILGPQLGSLPREGAIQTMQMAATRAATPTIADKNLLILQLLLKRYSLSPDYHYEKARSIHFCGTIYLIIQKLRLGYFSRKVLYDTMDISRFCNVFADNDSQTPMSFRLLELTMLTVQSLGEYAGKGKRQENNHIIKSIQEGAAKLPVQHNETQHSSAWEDMVCEFSLR